MSWDQFLTEHQGGTLLALFSLLWIVVAAESGLLWRIGRAKLAEFEKRMCKVETEHEDVGKVNIEFGSNLNRLTLAVETLTVDVRQISQDNTRGHDEIKDEQAAQGERIARIEGKLNNGGKPRRT